MYTGKLDTYTNKGGNLPTFKFKPTYNNVHGGTAAILQNLLNVPAVGPATVGRLPISRRGNVLTAITYYLAKMSAIPTPMRTGACGLIVSYKAKVVDDRELWKYIRIQSPKIHQTLYFSSWDKIFVDQ